MSHRPLHPVPPSPRRSARRRLLAFVAIVPLALLAACTPNDGPEAPSDSTAVFDEFNAMSGTARTDALVAAAQEEGVLVLYTASAGMQPIADAFEDKYDIPVELFTGSSESIFQRVVQESQAGLRSVDVYDDGDAFLLKDLELSYEYINPELTDRVPNYDPSLLVVPTRLSVFTFGWNTNLVDESELPDTLEGFLDPKWDGRLAMDPRNWEWYTGILDHYTGDLGWTEEQVDEMIETLASYSVFHERANVHAQLLLAGEIEVSLSVYVQSVDRELEREASAPIARVKSDGSYIKPFIFSPQGSALLKSAPHPAAAMLFVDFMLTDGQTILAQTDRTPTAITQDGGPLEGVPNEELFPVDLDKQINEGDTWRPRWEKLTGQ